MDKDMQRATKKESNFLTQLKHPTIVGFCDSYLNQNNNYNIVMEYCSEGSLQDKIKQRSVLPNRNGLPCYFKEDQVLNWFTMICLGVKYIHKMGVLHRDLKPKNIFLTK